MTKISHTNTTKFRKAGRFSMLALALSLSTGTVAGMFGIAALTSGPVQAQSSGNGGGGGPGGNGGAGPSPMEAFAAQPNNRNQRDPNYARGRLAPENCNGSADTIDIQKCRYNQRSTPRIVRINGFSNCAIIQQVPNPQGGQAEFYCVKPM